MVRRRVRIFEPGRVVPQLPNLVFRKRVVYKNNAHKDCTVERMI